MYFTCVFVVIRPSVNRSILYKDYGGVQLDAGDFLDDLVTVTESVQPFSTFTPVPETTTSTEPSQSDENAHLKGSGSDPFVDQQQQPQQPYHQQRATATGMQPTPKRQPPPPPPPFPHSNDGQSQTFVNIWRRSSKILEHREKYRDSVLLQREEEMRHMEERMQPQINDTSKSLVRDTKALFDWERRRQLKIKEMKDQREREELELVTGRPQLHTKHTIRHTSSSVLPDGSMVVDYGYDAGGKRTLPVHEKLYAEQAQRVARAREEEQTRLKQEKESRKLVMATSLATSSPQGQRSRDTSERLYKMYEVQKKKREDAIEEKLKSEEDDQTPSINSTSAKLASVARPDVPIHELLVYKGKLYEQKAQLRQALKDQNDQMQRRKTVALNRKSQQIVAEKSMGASLSLDQISIDSGTSSTIWDCENRLLKPTGKLKTHIALDLQKHSFKPKMNETSLQLVKNKPEYKSDWSVENVLTNQSLANADMNSHNVNSSYFYAAPMNSPGRFSLSSSFNGTFMSQRSKSVTSPGGPAIHHRSKRWAEERARKIDQSRKDREKEEFEECFFKPRLEDRRPKSATNIRNEPREVITGESIAAKNAAWLKKREDYLTSERKKKEDSALDGCSFAPALPTRRLRKSKPVGELDRSELSVEDMGDEMRHPWPQQKQQDDVFALTANSNVNTHRKEEVETEPVSGDEAIQSEQSNDEIEIVDTKVEESPCADGVDDFTESTKLDVQTHLPPSSSASKSSIYTMQKMRVNQPEELSHTTAEETESDHPYFSESIVFKSAFPFSEPPPPPPTTAPPPLLIPPPIRKKNVVKFDTDQKSSQDDSTDSITKVDGEKPKKKGLNREARQQKIVNELQYL